MIFSLLKNPLTKIVLNKATEHFKHKAEEQKEVMCPDGHRCSNYRSRVSVRI
jgi:hypothetical protein